MDSITEMMTIRMNAAKPTGLRKRSVKGSDIIGMLEESRKKRRNGVISDETYSETMSFAEYLFGSIVDNITDEMQEREIAGQDMLDVAQEFCKYEDPSTVCYFTDFISSMLRLPEETVKNLIAIR